MIRSYERPFHYAKGNFPQKSYTSTTNEKGAEDFLKNGIMFSLHPIGFNLDLSTLQGSKRIYIYSEDRESFRAQQPQIIQLYI